MSGRSREIDNNQKFESKNESGDKAHFETCQIPQSNKDWFEMSKKFNDKPGASDHFGKLEIVDDTLWGKHGDDPLKAIKPDAVHQGSLGDCYFLAPLASLAESNPQAIKDMIKTNKDGTYTVTFPGDPSHPVTVDAPTEDELQTYSHKDDDCGSWVNVIEKAHRKYTGRETSDKGDNPQVAIKLLTKAGTTTVDDDLSGKIFGIGRTDESNVEKDLKNAVKNNEIIVASTAKDNTLREIFGASNDPGSLINSHAFTVVGYDENSKTVKLRNPWGKSGEEGSFEMSLDDFYNKFENLKFSRRSA